MQPMAAQWNRFVERIISEFQADGCVIELLKNAVECKRGGELVAGQLIKLSVQTPA